MSSNLKLPSLPHSDPVRGGNLYRLAIVGAGTLKGKEIAEVLADRNFPSLDIKLLDDDESLGKLEAMKDEVTFIQSVRPEHFDKIDFTFFASDRESTRKTWKTARKAGSSIVDLSYALEDDPEVAVRSPWVERQLGIGPTLELQPQPAVVAHPASVALALLFLRMEKAGPLRKVSATVLQPASEHGQKGMDELHEQTVNLLSFQPLPKNVFDTQVAFNVVNQYGKHSDPPMASLERRILNHFQRITGKHGGLSLLLLQAPIFHGHVFALHVEMGGSVDLAQISQAIAGDHIKVTQPEDEAPNNVSAAGQGDILVSVLPDPRDASSLWVWAASDNLRISASNAVECAEAMAASRPRGKIQ
ncbi:MAG: segregation protein B [Acidobacteriales bacterium]|nr:segregation protein B [Terriglobales bacterium]